MCSILPTNDATEEAVGVVRAASSGTVPQWFYDTFQKSNVNLDLDYEAIWSAVNGIEDEGTRSVVVYQLRNSFGGYCAAYYYPPPATSLDSVIYNPGVTDQPWVDGGDCPTVNSRSTTDDEDDAASVPDSGGGNGGQATQAVSSRRFNNSILGSSSGLPPR